MQNHPPATISHALHGPPRRRRPVLCGPPHSRPPAPKKEMMKRITFIDAPTLASGSEILVVTSGLNYNDNESSAIHTKRYNMLQSYTLRYKVIATHRLLLQVEFPREETADHQRQKYLHARWTPQQSATPSHLVGSSGQGKQGVDVGRHECISWLKICIHMYTCVCYFYSNVFRK